MNRRGFIGTITAFAGLSLAKIKAPAQPVKLMYNGATLPGPTHLAYHSAGCFEPGYVRRVIPWVWTEDDYKHFAEYMYVKGKDGMRKWQPSRLHKILIDTKP